MTSVPNKVLGRLHADYRTPVTHLVYLSEVIGPADMRSSTAAEIEMRTRLAALQAYHVRQARESFPTFMQYCFMDSATGRPFSQQWFHDAWSRAMDTSNRVLVIAPRDHGKTSQIVGRTIWELGRDPSLRIKIACASDGRAKERLYEIVQHLESNPRVLEVFPHLRPSDSGEWSRHKIVVQRNVFHRDASIEALGITSTATGGRCVVPGTEVVTAQGLRAIETIKPGTRVLGSDGKYHPVATVLSREYTGEVVRVHVEGTCTDAVLTPEHPVMVYGMVDGIPTYQWRQAGELRARDLVVFPRRIVRSWDSMRRVFFTPHHALIPVQTVEREEYQGLVYDLSVPTARTFCAPSMIVHNCDLLIADDAVDRRNALSFPALREQIKQAWKSDWTNLLEPTSRVWYICTLWHKDDLSHQLMVNPAYDTHFYAIGDDFGAMWPEKWGEDELRLRHREIGSVEFNRGFRNNPVDDESSLVQGRWIQHVDLSRDDEFGERFAEGALVFFTCYDTAGSPTGKAGQDYSSSCTIAVDPERRRVYVVDAWAARLSLDAMARQVIKEFKKYNPLRILIEKVGQASLDEWVMNIEPALAPIIEVTKPRVSKAQRLMAVTPLMERGEVVFSITLDSDNAEWIPGRGDLIEQLLDFPFAKHDDLVDAFSAVLDAARRYFLDAWATGGDHGIDLNIGAEHGRYLL